MEKISALAKKKKGYEGCAFAFQAKKKKNKLIFCL